MEQIAVDTAAVVVLAEGPSAGEISNKRGHLFEKFIAQLLATQGYGEPRAENLDVTSEGIELDVEARHTVTGERVICECKSYSSNIRVPLLTSFLGKFALARADDQRMHGLFIGIPRLTSQAKEQAEAARVKLPGFQYLGSYDICRLLEAAKILPNWNDGPSIKSDPTVVITEHGIVMAACELDPETRRAFRWLVWSRNGSVPSPIISLIERELAQGLPVTSIGVQRAVVPIRVPSPPNIVEVQGSSSDFEYQLPAAPEFFVGRKALSQSLIGRIVTRASGGSIVINAKSGWGKSSLALQLKREIEKAGGVALVVDTRTAERSDFVAAAIERVVRRAVDRKIIELPSDAAFSTLQSVVETLKGASWSTPAKPLFIAFDQFENVFRDLGLTREFRDLAFLVRELNAPLTVSFSWKTDLVGWTEGHPYRFRDEIRDVSSVAILNPFGPREVETLLRRLERSLGKKLNRDLRQRLREYSQGLPWLFKKLAGHVLTEVGSGISQDELARQALNVQGLFESDLARLSPGEESLLRMIAQSAPVAIAELEDSVASSALLESLLHQRLVVQVGDRLDTYWDTFRDFLNTGRVALEDSYVVRYAPLGAGRLLRVVVGAQGSVSVPDAARELNTTATVVHNYARELRLFGVLSSEPNQVVIEAEIMAAPDTESAIRARVGQALRRHKMYKLAIELLNQEEIVPLQRFASMLPPEFPTVEAKSDSWFTYARSFCQWMEYAGLVRLRRDGMVRLVDHDDEPPVRLLSGTVPVRVRSAFPGANPGPSLQLLLHLSNPSAHARPSKNGFANAVRDLALLGVIERDAGERIVLSELQLVADGEIDPKRLRPIVERQRGMRKAFECLERNPGASPRSLGAAHRDALGADWAESTLLSVGKFIRSWARACGISTELRAAAITQPPSTEELFGQHTAAGNKNWSV
ncbi:restriction endonuclease [Actinomadura opuntiae]|uniref:restriction endonuclease n=1 Tax=Actinomadura sp. OS1-43 TaxID=604315 RepID=UPI00255AE929|nr:restriction endonuclease [Actinomadura sp. OS1-43]MDL4820138.1 restriction endonuclease [Actinomadura sp. OS1-43]